MHAEGSAAFCQFTVTHGITRFTKATIFSSNERFWIRFHLRIQQGIKNMTDAEATKLAGRDRESNQANLLGAIDNDNDNDNDDFPRWNLQIQVMPEKVAATCHVKPFDFTKVWPYADNPLMDVGMLELNRNPENYFAEVEQLAFNPAQVVPGISFSPDKMFQSRLFNYVDAQRYRLGVNHHQLPVNAPKCPFHTSHRDGQMRVDTNNGAEVGYEPNSKGALQEQPDFAEPPLSIEGAAHHWNHRVDDDYYSQPGKLFRLMTPAQHQVLFENTARSVGGAFKAIQERHIANCAKADPAYGAGVAAALQALAQGAALSPTPNPVV